jgi:queuine tRNA-ribosyltransferase catalytic subunit
VYPTRTARFGVALAPEGMLRLRNAACAQDLRRVCASSESLACEPDTHAYLSVHARL